jgi:HSP20 family protein
MWPDIPRFFSREPWRAVEEFFHDPFAGRGVLERWFGDFSSSHFQPRIDVVDEGRVLRVTAELPGMDREDLNVTVEDGALVLRGEKNRTCAARGRLLSAGAPMEASCARFRCRKAPTLIT